MPASIKPFNLNELEEAAALAEAEQHTDYIVYGESNDYAVLRLEHVSRSERAAWRQLSEWEAVHGKQFHLHRVTGRTVEPVAEEWPLKETCLNHACNS